MSDYDRQFEADLEKAQALSLESLALEQFRRQRQLSVTGLSDTDGSGSTVRNSVEPPPALPPPPRRLSRPRISKEPDISSGTSPTKDESSDLISFSSPTSKTPPKPHEVLKEYLEQINKLGQQTEELTISTPPDKMSNPYYNGPPPPYGYPPGVYYAPPYPVAPPYGMPHPYSPAPAPYPPGPYPPAYPPYAHTRLSAPAPATPGIPQYATPPQLNYDMTNLVSRPVRPLYPQLSQLQLHTYPPFPRAPTPQREPTNPAKETPRNSIQSNGSNRSSECNEAEDTLGSLPKSLNLIDFGKHTSGQGSVRVSVLEAFDPLLTEQSNNEYAVPSECSSSVYEEYDPLEFLYGETEMRDTPIYATINKRETKILPSPSPKSIPSVPAVAIRSTTNKLYDCITKTRARNFDNEHRAYLNMVLDIRKKLVHTCSRTNPGFVIAARSGGRYPPNTTIKVMVHLERLQDPITFTSDVESNVDHVIYTVICSLEEDAKQDMSEYMLRVWGANEYLLSGTLLSEYDYIRECVRLEKDVKLCLREGKDTSLARTERDDAKHSHLSLDDLIPLHASAPTLTFDNLSIMLETLEGELSRAIGITSAEGTCSPNGVFQAVKAICALAGCIETLHITNTLNAFAQACTSQSQSRVPEIISDSGQYSSVNIRAATARETVALQCGRVRDAVRALVALYSRTRPVDFQLNDTQYLAPSNVAKAERSSGVSENTLVCVEAVHVGSGVWNHEEYVVTAQLYHGTRHLSTHRHTHPARVDQAGFYHRIIYDTWITLEDVPINTLPREARLVLTLYGRTQKAEDNQHQNETQQNGQPAENGTDVQYEQEELGWAAIQMFDYDGMLASGTYILPVWPTCVDKRLGPAPNLFHAPPFTHPLINIEIPLYAPTGVKWTTGVENKEKISRSDLPSFDSLDGHTQSQLLHLIEQGAYQRMPTEGREVMWEKRQYLVDLPGALPLVLLAASHWYGEHRTQLLGLLELWEPPSPLNAMHLLLPCFPEESVRAYASGLLDALEPDLLILVLPQLVQALRHCTYETGAVAALLLRRALCSPPVAHALYWLLVHTLPHVHQAPGEEFLGINIEEGGTDRGVMEPNMAAWWRYQLLLRTLVHLVGDQLHHTLQGQQMLVKSLCSVAQSVKVAKEGVRQRALVAGAELLAAAVRDAPATLPLGLHRKVHDVDIKNCTFFSSNTLPLKINFIGCDNAVIPAMFKVGDDLRQDALVLQVMRVMDNLWLKAGLDLRMVTFQALPTNPRKGMIEIVTEAETLRAIQTEWGLTGSFKDKPIAEWLAKHNPSELEYQRARDNFTASCAGYSVATYLLGICDRHNDNIMLKTSGHLFHIDFGKFLGDAQMFGNFKRDRAPFVLTPDMVYVINGGERPTQRFQHFVELCCMAFNVVRAHHQHILDLFALMASSGVPGVSATAVGYVRGALLPAASNAEAAANFARLIHESLKSKFTPINFFLHNLAQMRASGDQGSSTSELLSFMPRTYTMSQEGRLVSVECLGYEKRYDPEKHYVYALRIYRQGQATPFVLYRSYKHFTELYQKICLHFPLAKVHSLPSGLHVGRSNVRQVAERRFGDVQAFLTSLFSLADEIAHSDLVYTFFHPLLRDQQEIEPQRNKHRVEPAESESSGSGSLKLSVQFAGGVLSVLILHAQSLALTPQGLPPNPYVKVYLIPDPTKETKRKTRVLKRNSHPSFMEMLEYRLDLEVVKNRSLQATVWNYDSLQENQFLGGVVIPLNSLNLREETVAWYPLQYIPR